MDQNHRPGFALLGFLLLGLLGGCARVYHQGPVSDHYDGRRFQNVEPFDHRFGAFLRWMVTRRPARWPDWIEAAPGPAPPRRVEGGRLRVTFIQHSTVLVQVDGLNILTDPVWSDRVGPFSWAGIRRSRAPGIPFEALPAIDLVLVSHDHYDHLDIPTLKRLEAEHHPLFLVGLGVGRVLRSKGTFPRVEEMDWWETVGVGNGVKVTMVPARHFSGRWANDLFATLWGGYVIRTPAGNIYFAGDTGYGGQFRQVRDRIGKVRLALLPIGAYEPRWFMAQAHISPDEAVRAYRDLAAAYAVGIHFGTFRQTDEAIDRPETDLAAALEKDSVPPGAFRVLAFGEGWEIPEAASGAP